jgi:hypothetical protein
MAGGRIPSKDNEKIVVFDANKSTEVEKIRNYENRKNKAGNSVCCEKGQVHFRQVVGLNEQVLIK